MSKRLLLGFAFCILFTCSNGRAQGVCPLNGTASNKLICVLPQVYGPLGLGTGTGSNTPVFANHSAQFEGDFISNSGLGPINEAIGTQLTQLPVASPSSAIAFVYDPSLKTFAPSEEETLGPILGERAGTIGRNRLYVGFSFQYFDFNTIDGQKLSSLTSVLQHTPFPADAGDPACPNQTAMTGTKYAGDPCFVRDFFQSTTNIDLSVHQYTVYATYGIAPRLDFSIVIPFLNVKTAVSTDTTIHTNSVAPITPDTPGGVFHQYNPAAVPSCSTLNPPCLRATFTNSGSATGIGDVVLRGKYQIYKGERAGIALGVDVRIPSGDEENFLGSGATGVKPFGVVSYRARVSPHAEIGYEVNGNSILSGDFVGPTATNKKGSIPNRLVYIVGADVSIIKRLTGAFDIYGQRLFGVPQIFPTTYTDLGKCSDVNCTTLTPGTTHADLGIRSTDYNITSASVGLKYRLFGHVVITGNALLKLDDPGLRAKAIPLVGISYSR